jgi:hypothetical protein
MPIFGLTGVQPPLIYGGSTNCCYTDTWELYLTATISVTINRIYFSTSAIPCPVDVIDVNGFPYTDPLAPPIVLSFGSSIKIKVQACPCQGVLPPNNFFLYNLNIDYTDNTGTYIETKAGGLQEINPQSATYDPVPASLTTLNLTPCIGTTGCDDILATIPFTNYSSFDVPVILDDGGNFPAGTKYYVDGILQVANILFVPGNSTVQLGFSFCWPNSTPPAPFFLDVIVCDVYSRKLTVNINPTYCLGCGVGCTDIQIETESGYLPTLTAGCNFQLPSVYSEAAIGEKKTIIWKYTYNNGFTNANFDLYLNPILWTNIQSILPVDPYSLPLPAEGWYIKILGYMVGAGLFDMYQVTGSVNEPSQKNWQVQVEIPNSNSLFIYFTFYMTMDIDNEITNTILDNYKRLSYSNINSTTAIKLSTNPDVYNTQRFLSKELFFVDNNVNDPNFAGERPFRCFLYRTIPMAARWYNLGLYGTNAEFTGSNPVNTQVSFSQERNFIVSSLTSFSIFEKTKITFQIDMQPVYTPNYMVAYIFSADNTSDNNIDWQLNNELSRSLITTIPGTSVLNGEIESPSTGPTNVAANTWKIDFHVGTGWDASKIYYVAVIVYDVGANVVNTFISNSISVDVTPSEDSLCCPLDIQTSWSDYINTYTNVYPLVTVYKQRLKNEVIVEGGFFASQCLFDLGFAGDWMKLITDVRLNVYAVRSINATQTAYFIYNQYQSIRQGGYPFDYNNLDPAFTVKDNGFGQLILNWEGRARWETGVTFPGSNVYIADNATPWNSSLAGPLGNQLVQNYNMTYNWVTAGAIFLQYIIRFDLSSILNLPNSQPFYVNKVILQRLDCFTEEPITPPSVNTPDAFNPLVLEGWTGSAYVPLNGPICPGDYGHVKATMTSLNPADAGYVIGFFNRSPYGILQLKEDDETGVSPSGFTQLDSQYIYDTTTGVQVGTWEFKIDINALPAGTYEICAMYLPL